MFELSDVTRTYGDSSTAVHALRGVDLSIADGEMVVVAGPSGSGKTTMLQLLGGLDRATSGSLRFEGDELGSLGDAELTRLRLTAFGFVFQQFNLIPTLTASENVQVPLAATDMGRHERERRAEELLGTVGLGDRTRHLPGQLSGGEQQRVAIARALANRPRVLLADEPTGNLDSTTGAEVLRLLRRLNEEEGRAVILITHDPSIAEEAPRLVRLADGVVVEDLVAGAAEAAGIGIAPRAALATLQDLVARGDAEGWETPLSGEDAAGAASALLALGPLFPPPARAALAEREDYLYGDIALAVAAVEHRVSAAD